MTAPGADFKVINRLLLWLKDWEYGSAFRMHLVTTRNAYNIQPTEADPETGRGRVEIQETEAPISSTLSNGWAGASIEDVEGFFLDAVHEDQGSIFILLDDKGVQEQNVVIAERQFDDDSDELTKTFNKMRVPWSDAYIVSFRMMFLYGD